MSEKRASKRNSGTAVRPRAMPGESFTAVRSEAPENALSPASRAESLTTRDVKHALALLNHLDRCHRAALEVPGVDSALQRTDYYGMHMHPAFLFVSNHLYELRRWCEQRIQAGEGNGCARRNGRKKK